MSLLLLSINLTFDHHISTNRGFFVLVTIVVQTSFKLDVAQLLVLVACIVTDVVLVTARVHLGHRQILGGNAQS